MPNVANSSTTITIDFNFDSQAAQQENHRSILHTLIQQQLKNNKFHLPRNDKTGRAVYIVNNQEIITQHSIYIFKIDEQLYYYVKDKKRYQNSDIYLSYQLTEDSDANQMISIYDYYSLTVIKEKLDTEKANPSKQSAETSEQEQKFKEKYHKQVDTEQKITGNKVYPSFMYQGKNSEKAHIKGYYIERLPPSANIAYLIENKNLFLDCSDTHILQLFLMITEELKTIHDKGLVHSQLNADRIRISSLLTNIQIIDKGGSIEEGRNDYSYKQTSIKKNGAIILGDDNQVLSTARTHCTATKQLDIYRQDCEYFSLYGIFNYIRLNSDVENKPLLKQFMTWFDDNKSKQINCDIIVEKLQSLLILSKSAMAANIQEVETKLNKAIAHRPQIKESNDPLLLEDIANAEALFLGYQKKLAQYSESEPVPFNQAAVLLKIKFYLKFYNEAKYTKQSIFSSFLSKSPKSRSPARPPSIEDRPLLESNTKLSYEKYWEDIEKKVNGEDIATDSSPRPRNNFWSKVKKGVAEQSKAISPEEAQSIAKKLYFDRFEEKTSNDEVSSSDNLFSL